MSGLGGLRYDNLEIGSGTVPLRLQQVRKFRARLARGGAQAQMRAPVFFAVTEQWCDQQDILGNQLGVFLLFLLPEPLPQPKYCCGCYSDDADDRQNQRNYNACPQRIHSPAPTFSTRAGKTKPRFPPFFSSSIQCRE